MEPLATALQIERREREEPPPLPEWMGVRGFVDLHAHVLAGLDDGPKTADAAERLVEAAWRAGTAAVVATPHFSFRYRYDRTAAERALDALERATARRPEIFLGCELEISDETFRALREDPRRYTLNGGRHALVELPHALSPCGLARLAERFFELGLTPILAHPERYPQMHTHPGAVREWIEAGGLLQITAESLTGRMGRRARRMAWDLVEAGAADFVASDAHDPAKRPPDLRGPFQLVAERVGVAEAGRLFTLNPLAVLETAAGAEPPGSGRTEDPLTPGLERGRRPVRG